MLCRRRQGRKKRGEERGLPERRNRAPLPLMQIKPERNQQCKRKQVQNNNNGKKLSPGQRQNCEQLTTRKIAKARQTIPRRQKADALLLLSRSFLFLACPPPVALLAGRVSFGVAGSASLQLRAPPARRPRSRSSRRRRRAASRAATGGEGGPAALLG